MRACKAILLVIFATGTAMLTARCDDATAPATGELRVTLIASGVSFDADGFVVILPDNRVLPLSLNAATVAAALPPGDHTIRLDGVAPNCDVVGQNPLTVRVQPGRTTAVAFAVTCRMGTGSVRVSMMTTGHDLDQDVNLYLDGGYRARLSTNDTLRIDSLAPGIHSIEIRGLAGNCSAVSGGARSVNVTEGGTSNVDFIATCSALAVLRVRTSTSGTDFDANGYRVVIGFGTPAVAIHVATLELPAGDAMTFTRLANGSYVVSMVDVAMNCAVDPRGPRTAVLTPGDTAEVAFAVTCAPASQLAFVIPPLGVLSVISSNGSGQSSLPSHNRAREPAWSRDGRRIAFASGSEGTSEIHVLDRGSGEVTRLTANGAWDGSPAWSPDGSRIAFVSGTASLAELYVMNADGSNRIRLTNNNVRDADPAWSPDGARIAFTTERDGNAEIYHMQPDGSDPVRLTNGSLSDFGPAWSPDGQRLAFTRKNCRVDRVCDPFIILARAQGFGEVVLAPGEAPAWSGDGGYIAYQEWEHYYYYDYFYSTGYIAVIAVDGERKGQLVRGVDPAWRW